MIQIEKFHKRSIATGKILSMLLPGAGHIWAGFPLKGSVILFLFFSLLLKFIYWDGIVVNPWLLNHARSYGGIVVASSLLGILYFYAIFNLASISGRLSQFLSLIKVARKELQIKK
jgi:hypothetical protein